MCVPFHKKKLSIEETLPNGINQKGVIRYINEKGTYSANGYTKYERLYAYLHNGATKKPNVDLLLNLVYNSNEKKLYARQNFDASAPKRFINQNESRWKKGYICKK